MYASNGAGDAVSDWLVVRGETPGPLFLPIRKGGSVEHRRMTTEAIYKVLVKRADGNGRVSVFEIMVRNSAIENHIRKGETFKIPSVMQTQRRIGMQLLDDHLLELGNDGTITREVAFQYAQLPNDPRQRLAAH